MSSILCFFKKRPDRYIMVLSSHESFIHERNNLSTFPLNRCFHFAFFDMLVHKTNHAKNPKTTKIAIY